MLMYDDIPSVISQFRNLAFISICCTEILYLVDMAINPTPTDAVQYIRSPFVAMLDKTLGPMIADMRRIQSATSLGPNFVPEV